MPLFPFRSSSVKPKGSGSSADGDGLFSKNRSTRNDGHSRASASTCDPRRRRRPSPARDELLSPEQGALIVRDTSRSRDPVSRPPPSRRGRSPSKRESRHRGSVSPSSRHDSPTKFLDDRRLESPGIQRHSSSGCLHPKYLPHGPALSAHLQASGAYGSDRRSHRHASPLPIASTPSISNQAHHAGPPDHHNTSVRRIASGHHKSSFSGAIGARPPRSAVPARPSNGSRRSTDRSATHATYSSEGFGGVEANPKRHPDTFSTYQAVKELSKEADRAREWIDWLDNVNDAPDEIRLLSSKVKIAKDTVAQIQISLEARPDLIEDELGQNLKMQIAEVIVGTSETLRKMRKLLSSFTAATQQDGTALDRLEGFWQSLNYKNEGKAQIRATDTALQIQLTELSTLMSNIYARALRSPKLTFAKTTTPQQPFTEAKSWKTLNNVINLEMKGLSLRPEHFATSKETRAPVDGKASSSSLETSPIPVAPAPDTPPISPQSTSLKTEERPGRRQIPPTPESPDIVVHGPSEPGPRSPPRTQQPSRPPRISIDLDPSPTDVLLDAAWEGNLRAVAEALRRAPPNACDHQNLTALHFAVERDHMPVAMLLLDRGADVHARADGGCMPLHLAARYASADTVEMLIDRAGADPNARSSDGRTPLHYAARSAVDGDDERREVIRTLRDLGTDPTLTTRKGETARDVAQKRDHWDAAATLRRAEKTWEQENNGGPKEPNQNLLQRYNATKA